ncbi:ribosome biogenesis/translation initiation ATPase RLI [Candidatus Woesearchaeota archaeon]|nr:ribosome biogenesis/translation initiation ATPase RLI [Candidatus Woesearchaeota archaeon]
MKRIAVVDNEKLKDMQKKLYIQGLCPVNRRGIECIKIEDKKLYIDELTCIGCGICVKAAPESIKVINLPEALNQQPIHRYGENEFMLYSLPTPVFGKVVGVIGKNGVGKSTALKIISGNLKPNLGDYEQDGVGYDELIQFFKGTEAQGFFERMKKGEIKASYKPQHVDLLPKTAKGKVGNLLKKIDEKKRFDQVIELLDLGNILENDLATLSGGELQRVAIAATVLRDANLYIFDEPSSFLDIEQRIRVSRFIKGLADEKTAVLVVEHDLIILDYMTDNIHIMYGEEGAYGIVSQPKATRVGINVFLDGYLKEENIRFRDHEIRFFQRPPEKHSKNIPLCSWEQIECKLGRFHLKAVKGELHREKTIGVVGKNGIGKTSFVKLLAGVMKPDKGKLNEKLRVAYKPQYIEGDETLVITVLKEAIDRFNALLVQPLALEELFYKPLNTLSGGQLQRVAIARCLSQDVDLFLMDEPSAYLDIEQRLLISKIIRDLMEQTGKTALIVDHDLLFIDYLSDELIVFEGKPAIEGEVKGPFSMEAGMNQFLGGLNITLRRDEESHRPRINKPGSQKDRQQRSEQKLYYS